MGKIVVILLMGLIFITSGCVPGKQGAARHATEALPFTRVKNQNVNTGKDEKYQVYQSQDFLNAGLDLTNKVAVLAQWGQKPSAGYDIKIAGIVEENETNLKVIVSQVSPSADKMYASVITYPKDIVLIDRKILPQRATVKVTFVNQSGQKLAQQICNF